MGAKPTHPRRAGTPKNMVNFHPSACGWPVWVCGAVGVMKNVYICFESGDSALIYAGGGLSVDECRQFAEKVSGGVSDAYELSADELQYYNIGGRVWADTPEKVAKLRSIISK